MARNTRYAYDRARYKLSLKWKFVLSLLTISLLVSVSFNFYQNNTYTAQQVLNLQSQNTSIQNYLLGNLSLIANFKNEIRNQNTSIASLQMQNNILTQQLSNLLPVEVHVYGTATSTGGFTSPNEVHFMARGITYVVLVKDGHYDIHLPSSYKYSVCIQWSGFLSGGCGISGNGYLDLVGVKTTDHSSNLSV
jgi:hypothetical protein